MKSNIILIGQPLSGKTSLARQLAEYKKMHFIDFDNHVLEKIDSKTAKNIIGKHRINVAKKIVKKQVGEIIKVLGEDDFIKLGENLILHLEIKNTVLAISGVLPLTKEAIEHLKETGKCVFLDVPKDIILTKMEKMNEERIIGIRKNMKKGMKKKDALNRILDEKQKVCETYCDYNFKVDEQSTKKAIFDTFIKKYV